MGEEIQLSEIFSLVKQHITKILSCTLLGIVGAAIILFFVMTPKYSSQTQLIAQLPQDNQVIGNGVNNNLMMINTYKDLVKSNIVMDDASEQLNQKYHYDMNAKAVNSAVTVSQKENSQMFTIQATATSPAQAKNIANVVADVFKNKALKVMKVDKISITSKAIENPQPVSPNKSLGLLIGALLGFLIGIIWMMITSLKDKTVKSEEWIVDTLGINILGNIPKMESKDMVRSSKK